MADADEEAAAELRLHGEKVLKKINRMNAAQFAAAVKRDRDTRTDAQIKAAYAEAMREKAKGQG